MVKVRTLITVAISPHEEFAPGSELELNEKEAFKLIKLGYVENITKHIPNIVPKTSNDNKEPKNATISKSN